jgi:membrane fusion protein, multidrug efflux system
MSTRTSRLSRAPLLVLCALVAAACGSKEHGAGGHGGMPPGVVAVEEVKLKTVPVEFEYPAQTAGSREVEVRSRVPGILLKRNFEEGATVRAGQSLFTVDPAPYEAVIARTEADVTSAEVRLANAQRNSKRLKPLFEAKAISQKEYDDAVSGEEVAGADLKSARARLTEARLNLGYTAVTAPVSGVTSRSVKSEGTLVAGPTDLLTTVTQVDPMYVNFGVAEAEQSRLRNEAAAGKLTLPPGNRFDVTIRFEDGKTYSRAGKLSFTDVRVNNVTGTSDARAELPNPNGEVRPGQFVRVVLKGASRPQAITVPQKAVMESPQGKLVYVLGPENKAVPKPVTLGEWVAGNEWVVFTGLAPGDKVIVDGLMKVYPGAQVMVGDPNAPPPGGPPKGGPPPKK